MTCVRVRVRVSVMRARVGACVWDTWTHSMHDTVLEWLRVRIFFSLTQHGMRNTCSLRVSTRVHGFLRRHTCACAGSRHTKRRETAYACTHTHSCMYRYTLTGQLAAAPLPRERRCAWQSPPFWPSEPRQPARMHACLCPSLYASAVFMSIHAYVCRCMSISTNAAVCVKAVHVLVRTCV